MPNDLVKVACDAVSLRSFMTYLVKKHDGSERRAASLQTDAVLRCSTG